LQSLLWVVNVGALVQEGGQGLVVTVYGGVDAGQVEAETAESLHNGKEFFLPNVVAELAPVE
jgi:hypothetical protein